MARKSDARVGFISRVLSVLTEMRNGTCKRIQGSIDVIQEPQLDASVAGWADVIGTPYREVESVLVSAGSNRLRQIDHAIDLLHRGRYGTCEECGKEIPLERLEAVPYATLCIKCAHKQPVY
ncbi:MAG TPA: TraR/DksA C4-type zinc finger protein [Candidatus Staskawiczbacteria bacterium]|nr:TraR/DksA C4-type zinc finger protein [Candidatus Staskawiczbacteria bacterium]